jgi:hypothetical protein
MKERLKRYLESREEVIASRPNPTGPEPLTMAEKNPDKNYDELSFRLPFNVKVKFLMICSKIGRTPSAQAEALIEEYVTANANLLED